MVIPARTVAVQSCTRFGSGPFGHPAVSVLDLELVQSGELHARPTCLVQGSPRDSARVGNVAPVTHGISIGGTRVAKRAHDCRGIMGNN